MLAPKLQVECDPPVDQCTTAGCTLRSVRSSCWPCATKRVFRVVGRPASTIRLHFGALGKRGFRKLLTPTPAEAQEVADLRRAFLAARAARARTVATNRARPAGPRRTGPTQAQKDDAWRAAKAFHSANVAVWKAAEGDAAALQLLRDG